MPMSPNSSATSLASMTRSPSFNSTQLISQRKLFAESQMGRTSFQKLLEPKLPQLPGIAPYRVVLGSVKDKVLLLICFSNTSTLALSTHVSGFCCCILYKFMFPLIKKSVAWFLRVISFTIWQAYIYVFLSTFYKGFKRNPAYCSLKMK